VPHQATFALSVLLLSERRPSNMCRSRVGQREVSPVAVPSMRTLPVAALVPSKARKPFVVQGYGLAGEAPLGRVREDPKLAL
jgi:hypothetical protein